MKMAMENTGPADKQFIIVEIIEYAPNSPVIKTVVRKTGMEVTASTFESDDVFIEKTVPVDMAVQLIEGSTEIAVNDKISTLETGQALKIPARSRHQIKPFGKFKLVSTYIKYGYE